MFDLKKLQAEIIEEFTKNSSIKVHTDLKYFEAAMVTNGYGRHFKAGAVGGYNRDKKEIYFCPENSKRRGIDDAYMLGSLIHEIAHASQGPLDRHIIRGMVSNGEEVVAEFVALRIMTMFGWVTPRSIALHTDYIESWSVGAEEVDHALWTKEAKKAFDFILKNWLPEFSAKYKVHKEAA